MKLLISKLGSLDNIRTGITSGGSFKVPSFKGNRLNTGDSRYDMFNKQWHILAGDNIKRTNMVALNDAKFNLHEYFSKEISRN